MQSITTLTGQRESASSTPLSDRSAVAPPRPLMQDFWLWILLVGPLVAPLFAYLQLPVLQPFAEGIYLLGRTVCPKVGVHFMVLGHPMAVCSSCWAAVWGLWSVRLLYGRAGEGFGLLMRLNLRHFWQRWQETPASLKIAVVLAGFFPWALDVMLWDSGLWQSPHLYMLFAGFLGGFSAALLLLPAASAMRSRLARTKRV
ncbi:MAG TPA: hypothetical protein VM409_01730 [Chloroflexia bacterium]|nr:hypothetical protein [Chloroflexia bacterium]